MPARLHAAIALTGVALLLVAMTARRADGAPRPWRWPIHGELVGTFRVTPRTPFAAGQRRGIRIAAAPGTTVRAACGGRVVFAGAVGRAGPTLSIRCGVLLATYQGLRALRVHRGAFVGPADPVATVGRAGVLRLGARRAPGRYVDPLALLGADPSPPLGLAPRPAVRPIRTAPGADPSPPLGLAPRPAVRPTRAEPAEPPAVRPLPGIEPAALRDGSRPLAARAPWPAWLGLALLAFGTPLGAVARRRRSRALATRVPRGART